jgi:hypothetical protein
MHDPAENKPDCETNGAPESSSLETVRDPSRTLVTERGTEPPTDAEMERGILDAVRLGALDVARVLARQLEERRRERAGNVVPIRASRD